MCKWRKRSEKVKFSFPCLSLARARIIIRIQMVLDSRFSIGPSFVCVAFHTFLWHFRGQTINTPVTTAAVATNIGRRHDFHRIECTLHTQHMDRCVYYAARHSECEHNGSLNSIIFRVVDCKQKQNRKKLRTTEQIVGFKREWKTTTSSFFLENVIFFYNLHRIDSKIYQWATGRMCSNIRDRNVLRDQRTCTKSMMRFRIDKIDKIDKIDTRLTQKFWEIHSCQQKNVSSTRTWALKPDLNALNHVIRQIFLAASNKVVSVDTNVYELKQLISNRTITLGRR